MTFSDSPKRKPKPSSAFAGQDSYRNPLSENTSLEVYNGGDLIFKNSGKWLYPLFDLEEFLKNFKGDKSNLRAHDTAIGKAAAVLMFRMNIHHIHANLISELALEYLESKNRANGISGKENENEAGVEVHFDSKVCRLLCATEDLLAPLSDEDEMYFLLRQRAKRILGVSVSVKNLNHDFGNIKNLSFELAAGGRLMILGENGSGKTTLLRLIAGIYSQNSGEILIGGKNIKHNPKFSVGYIPQNADNNSVSLSVEEVVSLGIRKDAKPKERRKIVDESLAKTGSLSLKSKNFSSLSGGEKQKVQMSRCLAQNAKLLLLDEPTSALDTKNRAMVTEILRSLSLTEIPTIIVVTHDKDLVSELDWPHLDLKKDSDSDLKKETEPDFKTKEV